MNTGPWDVWVGTALLLAVATTIVVGLAATMEKRVQTASWRRIIWQVCVLSLLAIAALELLGFGHGFARDFVLPRQSDAVVARNGSPVNRAWFDDVRNKVAAKRLHQPDLPPPPAAASPIMKTPGRSAGWWIAVLWMSGAGVVLGRIVVAQILRECLRWRCRRHVSAELLSQAGQMAKLLGWKKTFRVWESRGSVGPMAFGIVRPTIVVPRNFEGEFPPSTRAVALAHELAHLAKADPAWYLLADVMAMLLWWHPCAWWARRRLHLSSEMVADESSLTIEDGPGLLAECLLRLGQSYAARRTLTGLGVTGLRSGLACRVERLLNLSGSSRTLPWKRAGLLVRILGPAVLVLGAACAGAWTMPLTQSHPHGKKVEIMQNVHSAWKRSALALTFVGALGATTVADTTPRETVPPTKLVAPTDSKREKPDFDPGKNGSSGKAGSKYFDGKKAIEMKLHDFVLEEFSSDNLPLSEIVQRLIQETRKRDPQSHGVNFLILNPNQPAAINSGTGWPESSEPIDTGAISIRIVPPLRNLRLKDVLEAVTQSADRPLRYSIKDYGIVFQAGVAQPPSGPLMAKTYRMDTNTFFETLSHVFGVPAPDANKPGAESRSKMLRSFFQELGIELEAPKTVYFNDRLGILMVRVAADEIELVDAAVETLGGTVHQGTRASSSGDATIGAPFIGTTQ